MVTYTSNYTHVQAPATAPAVNNSPILALPEDTDLWTVANLYQALKALGDNEDLLLRILGGTLSAKSLAADGVGGAASTPPNGTVLVSGVASGTTAPTPTIARYALFKELIPFAWASVSVSGGVCTLLRGVNISSVFYNGVGDYLINFVTAAPDTTYGPLAVPRTRLTTLPIAQSAPVSGSQASVSMISRDGSGAGVCDSSFTFLAYSA